MNLQGDEPLMPPAIISGVAAALQRHALIDIATAVAPVRSLEEFLDPGYVKALRAQDGRALVFQPGAGALAAGRGLLTVGRPLSPAPGGTSGFMPIGCEVCCNLPPGRRHPLEIAEKLEQLRALEYGMSIYLLALAQAPPAGVDTPRDLERVRSAVDRAAGQPRPAGIKSPG